MKTRKTKPTLILLAIALWLGTAMPTVGQTELYKQYSHLKDVTVACIMNFHVNDTTQVELTILAPQTKEAVYTLVEEFNLGLDKEEVYNQFGQEKKYTLYIRNVCKDDIKKRFGEIKSADDYKNVAILAYNYNTGTILVFHNIETEERDNVIGSFLTNTLIDQELFPSVDDVNNNNNK
ncbi:MAG: hypothetical protein J6V54_09975 [Bacteroidales bacterium]|nr:hypothetical protein [Bacteroidales bacterium]